MPRGVLWDEWEAFEAAVQSGTCESPSSKKSAPPLVIAGLFQKWNPAAMHTANILDNLRDSGNVEFASIFILEVTPKTKAKAQKYHVMATPALVFFWKGIEMTIRRSISVDSKSFVGPVHEEELLEMIQFANQQGHRNNCMLRCAE